MSGSLSETYDESLAQGKEETGPETDKRNDTKTKHYCVLCSKSCLKSEVLEHDHSMLHHRELDNVLGRGALHQCQACDVLGMGLNEYAMHISSGQHKHNLKIAAEEFIRPIPLQKILSYKVMRQIQKKNKIVANLRRRDRRKKKKQLNKPGNANDVQKTQNIKKKKLKGTPNKQTKNKPNEVSKGPSKTVLWPKQKEVGSVQAQNKENQLAGKPGWDPSRQSSAQHPYAHTHFNPLPHPPVREDYSFPPNWPGGAYGPWPYQGDGFNPNPTNGQDGFAFTFYQMFLNYYRQYSSEGNQQFTRDELPSAEAFAFGPNPASSASSKPEPRPGPSHASNPPPPARSKPASKPLDFGFTRETDVNDMLREVRRSLGLREPCRADRKARALKGRSEADVQKEPPSSTMKVKGQGQDPPASPQSGSCTKSHTSSQDNTVATPVWSDAKSTGTTTHLPRVQASTVHQMRPDLKLQKTKKKERPAAANSENLSHKEKKNKKSTKALSAPSLHSQDATKTSRKQTALRGSPKKAQPKASSRATDKAEQLPSGGEQDPQVGSTVPRLASLALPATLSKRMGKSLGAEPNLNAARRVRNVSELRKGEGDKEAGLKPTLQKMLGSWSCSKVNWKELYQEARRKRQEQEKGMPRFGIELVNPLPDPESSAPAEDLDIPLSEGFQWEDEEFQVPPHSECPSLHLPPVCDLITQSQAEARGQGYWDQARTPADAEGSLTKAAEVTVKREADLEEKDQSGALTRNQCANSEPRKPVVKPKDRKRKVDGETENDSMLDQSRQKKKSKKNLTPVDRLLAVSLKEEELNQSLQEVDSSLIQARHALQAAYTEVQRLLLLKQQFTTEMDHLRTTRIEMLQAMQDGHSEAISMTKVVASFPTEVPAALSNTPSVSPSPVVIPAKVSIKQECVDQFAGVSVDLRPRPMFPSNQVPEASPATPDPQPLDSLAVERLTVAPPPCTASQPPGSLAVERLTLAPPPCTAPCTQVKQKRAEERNKPERRVVEEKYSNHSDSERQVEIQVQVSDPTADSTVLEMTVDQSHAAADTVREEDDDDALEIVEDSLELIEITDSDNEGESRKASGVGAPSALPQAPPQVETTTTTSAQTVTFKEDVTPRKSPTASPQSPDSLPEFAEGAEPDEPWTGQFPSHGGAVLSLQIHDNRLYTCSADNTARAYGLQNGEIQAVFEGHTNKINCLLLWSPPRLPARLFTGSSDQTVRCFSIKTNKCLEVLTLPQRVLCLHIAWNVLYAGLANGSVVSFDMKNLKQLDVFDCHGPRGVSCLGTSQEGARRVLLVGSYDSTISVRDIKSGLLLRSLEGHTKTVLCMKVVNDLVFSGSSDSSVHAHNIHTGELKRIYKGHKNAVTSIAILGKVMVTSCLDKLVHVYELQSHDRLQVYGGHSDMIMGMAVHKSVIYTGCYDGCVQAVRLNLMKNYRCQWHGCCLIFGVAQHLTQHLLQDHNNPQLYTSKCRWKGCATFFASRDAIKQDMPQHMQNHAENESSTET